MIERKIKDYFLKICRGLFNQSVDVECRIRMRVMPVLHSFGPRRPFRSAPRHNYALIPRPPALFAFSTPRIIFLLGIRSSRVVNVLEQQHHHGDADPGQDHLKTEY